MVMSCSNVLNVHRLINQRKLDNTSSRNNHVPQLSKHRKENSLSAVRDKTDKMFDNIYHAT